jgi:hypothetical protein
MLNGIMGNVIMLNVIMLSFGMLNVLKLRVIMLSFIMLSIIMLNVVAPYIVPFALYFPAWNPGQADGTFFLTIKSKTIIKSNYLYILAKRHYIMNIILLIAKQYDKKKKIGIS